MSARTVIGTKMVRLRVIENVLLLPSLDSFVKNTNAILVLFFHFSKAAKSIFTMLIGARAHSDGRPGGFSPSVRCVVTSDGRNLAVRCVPTARTEV